MTRLPGTSTKGCRLILFAALALSLPAAFAGHADRSRTETVVAVQPGRYVVAGQTHTGLDALRSAVRSTNAGSVLILSCSPAATASWLAAVQRLDDLAMHLDVADGSSPACAAAMPASARQDTTGNELDPAVQRYWSARQP